MERPGWTPTGQLATCTSWNDAKSYGFVRIDGAGAGSREGRVWVSREALLDLGEKKLWRGQAARCEVAESAQGDGLAATSVTWVANMDDEAVAMAAKNEEDKIDALVSFTGLGRATCQRYLEESEGDYEGACLQAYRYVVARAWDPRSGATQVDELVDVLVLAVPSSRSTIRSLASLLFPPHPHTTHLTPHTQPPTHTHTSPATSPPPRPPRDRRLDLPINPVTGLPLREGERVSSPRHGRRRKAKIPLVEMPVIDGENLLRVTLVGGSHIQPPPSGEDEGGGEGGTAVWPSGDEGASGWWYVHVKVGEGDEDQATSESRWAANDPEWNQTFTFTRAENDEVPVEISLCDASETVMATASFSMAPLKHGKESDKETKRLCTCTFSVPSCS